VCSVAHTFALVPRLGGQAERVSVHILTKWTPHATLRFKVSTWNTAMPTLKPRVQVTLEPSTHEVIERFASLQGRTRGSVIAEMLDSIAPSLARTVALLEAAAEAPNDVKRGLRAAVEGIQSELVGVAGDASSQLDFLMSELSGKGADPHVVTRGSGSGGTRGSGRQKEGSKPVATRVSGKGGKDAGSQRPV
jgi:hypothetical protein